MSKPLDESSNSNQSQTPYEFINRKSGFFSQRRSAVIAVGSLAIALSIAVPSFGTFVVGTVNSAFGISPASAAVTTNETPRTELEPGTTFVGVRFSRAQAFFVSRS